MLQDYSKYLTCGHCGYRGLGRVLTGYCERDGETVKSPCGYLAREVSMPWGIAYVLSECGSCGELTLTEIFWHDQCSSAEEYTYTVLYPEKPTGKTRSR